MARKKTTDESAPPPAAPRSVQQPPAEERHADQLVFLRAVDTAPRPPGWLLSPERVVFLLKQVCLSLSEAHALGLVHRDIKPANLFVCRLGSEYDFVKVVDFGVVSRHERATEAQITTAGCDPVVG